MKKDFSVIVLFFVFFIGLSLILYPSLANFWNQKTQSRNISSYENTIKDMTPKDYSDLFAAADDYNDRLRECENQFSDCETLDGYNDALNISGTGVMGYITIEKIKVELPIYHGVSADVLNTAVGHLEGSSLPAGGVGTHCVLSAHRGLPSARLFTELDKLECGDTFTLTILDRVLTYEVDQIRIVYPDEISDLFITDGMDYCTLLTCTPYGINTRRLLVRGTRIETVKPKPLIYIENQAFRIDPLIVTPVVALPMLLILFIILMVKYRPQKKRH